MLPFTVAIVVCIAFLFFHNLSETKSHLHVHPSQISGIVYGIIMGALTGYFSIVVGSLFSIAGVVGIAAAAFHGRKAIATLVCFFPS